MITSCYGIWTNCLLFNPRQVIVARQKLIREDIFRAMYRDRQALLRVHMYDKCEVQLIRIE